MPERNTGFGGGSAAFSFKDTVCIDCNKIMDSCRDKDCLEDLKVFLCDYAQEIVDHATNIRCRDAEIIWTHVTVEPIAFNRGFYQVDIRFFFKLEFEVCVCLGKTQTIEGIAVFDKKVILFGSEGNINIFKSDPSQNNFCGAPEFDADNMKNNLPIAVVEVVDPICLGVKILEKGFNSYCCCSADSIPEHVSGRIRGQLSEDGEKELVVTLGLFAIIRLERPTQIVVPCSEYCIPEKECPPHEEENPCDLFKKMKFPIGEFFPPSIGSLGANDNILERERNRDRDRDGKCCGKDFKDKDFK